RLFTQAKKAGREDLRVNHRMSGFWSFILAIAEQEGTEVLQGLEATMAAVDQTQTAATEFSDDLLELLTDVLLTHKDLIQRWIKMPELRECLNIHAGLHNSVSTGVRNAIQ